MVSVLTQQLRESRSSTFRGSAAQKVQLATPEPSRDTSFTWEPAS